jgi:DNA-binding response OmpR family regulator
MLNTTKILIVEEDKSLLAKLIPALHETGFEVLTAKSWNEIGAHLKQHSLALIILSVELAGENGYLIFKKLKNETATAQTPIIITSSSKTAVADFQKHRQLKLHAEAYLPKPYELLALFDCISETVGFPEMASVPLAPSEHAKVENIDEDLQEKHKKALAALRDFYREKLEKLQHEFDALIASQSESEEQKNQEQQQALDQLQQQVQVAMEGKAKAEQELEKERQIRKRISDALKEQNS